MKIAAPLNTDPAPELQWIEIATSFQIPYFHIIGLPGPEVAEAKERIRSAITSSGYEFPRRKVVINLCPAAIRKRGTGSDLAMAFAVLSTQSDPGPDLKVAAWGELGLDGTVKTSGQITRAIFSSWKNKMNYLILSHADYLEGIEKLQWVKNSRLLDGKPPVLVAAHDLREAWNCLNQKRAFQTELPLSFVKTEKQVEPLTSDLMSITPSLERSLGVTASGAHHALLLGPRGTGKSHAMEWLVALQPNLDFETKVRHALLAELNGLKESQNPVRRVSTQVKPAALLGTERHGVLKPGEYSLAHGGLLIADELPEWSRDSRESLREPLERGYITITRARSNFVLPAEFTLAANGNLCPCGGWPAFLPIPIELKDELPPKCKCGVAERNQYLARISGPVLDRIDLILLVAGNKKRGKTQNPEQTQERVSETRERLFSRYGTLPGKMKAQDLERLLKENPAWSTSIDSTRYSSLRSKHKILRLALTLSQWDKTSAPSIAHFLEASCYRPERYGFCD